MVIVSPARRVRNRCACVLLTAAIAAVRFQPSSFADDWPMWRHDPARSGATPASLPDRLAPAWIRELPPPTPAWPEEPRLQFDPGYEPIIAGERIFIASPVDGSVRAYELATGRELWHSYTDGPVRFAPVVWQDKVFAGSDDGFLYAFDAGSGRLLQRIRGADCPPRLHLGNGRLIDMRPVRGGPVVADGIVYFAAGIWPTMGIFIHAIEAATGKPVWTNSDCFWIPRVRIDHNNLADAGLSPQGYLVLAGGKLLLPNGRSMPAGLNPRTGRLLYYVQGYRNGHCRVVASPVYALVGTSGVMDVATGREVGSKWKDAGKNAPQGFDAARFDLFEGPFFPYKFMPECNAWSVVTDSRVYGLDRGVFYAYDLTRPKVSDYTKKHGAHKLHPRRWDLPLLWKLATPLAGKRLPCRALILAGTRLYGAVGSTLFAVELPSAPANKPAIAWSLDLKEQPVSMAAGGDRLVISTEKGRILCLAPDTPTDSVRRLAWTKSEIEKSPEPALRKVRNILSRAERTDGFAVVLDRANAVALARAFLAASGMHVAAVVDTPKTARAFRDELGAAGLYGRRIEVFVAGPAPPRFPDYLADIVVCPVIPPSEAAQQVADVFRILHPYGGAAFFPSAMTGAVKRFTRENPDNGAVIDQFGEWCVLRRRGKLPGAAEWTHECADSARTFYSRDERVRPPLGVLWYGDGPDYGFWKMHDYGSGVKPQVAGGRLFALRQRTPSTLTALDVYTGRRLWERKTGRFCRYAAFDNGVYLADGDRFIVLDPTDGKVRLNVSLDVDDLIDGPVIARDNRVIARDIRVDGDAVVVSVGPGPIRGGSYLLMQIGGLWDGAVLIGLDRRTGKILWRRKARNRFCNNALAMGDGFVFCTDSFSPVEGARLVERGVQISSVTSTILALDARSGKVRWQESMTNPYMNFPPGNWLGMRANDDWVSYSRKHHLLLAGRSGNIVALDGRTGEKRWERKGGGQQPVIMREDTCITQSGAILEIATGKYKGSVPTRHHGCNYAVAGAHLLFVRDAFVSYTDLDSPSCHRYWLRNIRSGCSASLIPADGVLNAPCFSVGCVCNYPIQTSFALVTLPETKRWAKPVPLKSPEKAKPSGPAGSPHPPTSGRVLIPQDAVWRYWDHGVVAAEWKKPEFDDHAWPAGKAELGYGDGDEATVVSYGNDPKKKFITTWFRHTFTVEDPKRFKKILLSIRRDDGAIVYLNGVEVFRTNMPSGPVDAAVRASSVTAGRNEKAWFTTSLTPDLLRKGKNVIAVEVHQANPQSSDISFAIELRGEEAHGPRAP